MRRPVQALVVVALALAAASPSAARTGTVQLGAAMNDGGFASSDARYLGLFRSSFQAFTPESAYKMTETEPTKGSYQFGVQDQMRTWAASNAKQLHGHTLIWCADDFSPDWLVHPSEPWTTATLGAVLDDYIRTVVGRYKSPPTQIPTWDVVNEAFNADGTTRDCVWSRVLGPGYVETALRTAHAADPAARLFYNEYNADLVNTRFRAVESMAADFRARGVPLDGVGLQMHLFGPSPPQYRIEEAMSRLAAQGLDVHVSELDDKTSAFRAPSKAEALAREAQAFQTVASACERQPACFRVTTWGLTDAWSFRGPDELALAWDADYGPKPGWEALRRGLRLDPAPAGNRAPGSVPAPAADATPNRGAFTLRWPGTTDPDGQPLTYALDRRSATGTTWSRVASGIRGTSYTFAGDQYAQYPEAQGTWVYRVTASDGWADGGPSPDSAPVVVDRGSTPSDPLPEPAPTAGNTASSSSSEPPPPDPGPPPADAPAPAVAQIAASSARPALRLRLLAPVSLSRARLRTAGLRVQVRCTVACRGRLRLTAGGRRLVSRLLAAGPAQRTVTLRPARTTATVLRLSFSAPGAPSVARRVRIVAARR